MMFGARKPPTPGGLIVGVLVAVVFIILLFAAVSIDANREQEAFNRGAILVLLGTAVAILVPLLIRMAAGPIAERDLVYMRIGGAAFLFLALVGYFIAASIYLGRVL